MGCEDKLKNEEEEKPATTPEFDGIKISDDLIKRLKTGGN